MHKQAPSLAQWGLYLPRCRGTPRDTHAKSKQLPKPTGATLTQQTASEEATLMHNAQPSKITGSLSESESTSRVPQRGLPTAGAGAAPYPLVSSRALPTQHQELPARRSQQLPKKRSNLQLHSEGTCLCRRQQLLRWGLSLRRQRLPRLLSPQRRHTSCPCRRHAAAAHMAFLASWRPSWRGCGWLEVL